MNAIRQVVEAPKPISNANPAITQTSNGEPKKPRNNRTTIEPTIDAQHGNEVNR